MKKLMLIAVILLTSCLSEREKRILSARASKFNIKSKCARNFNAYFIRTCDSLDYIIDGKENFTPEYSRYIDSLAIENSKKNVWKRVHEDKKYRIQKP